MSKHGDNAQGDGHKPEKPIPKDPAGGGGGGKHDKGKGGGKKWPLTIGR
jgi:hypothetical protein